MTHKAIVLPILVLDRDTGQHMKYMRMYLQGYMVGGRNTQEFIVELYNGAKHF